MSREKKSGWHNAHPTVFHPLLPGLQPSRLYLRLFEKTVKA